MFARAARRKAELPALWPSARALAIVVTLQVVLGLAALWLMLPLGGNPRTPTLWQARTLSPGASGASLRPN